MELESDHKLAFMDMEIHHHEDERLTNTVYRKKTHTDKNLQFDSYHPMAYKQAVVKTLFFNRVNRICSSLCEKELEEKCIFAALRNNGYHHILRLPQRNK